MEVDIQGQITFGIERGHAILWKNADAIAESKHYILTAIAIKNHNLELQVNQFK